MSDIVFETPVFARKVTYKNFKGETNTVELFFALDPLSLLSAISKIQVKPNRSGNPAKRGSTEIGEDEQIRFVRELASAAAGEPSDDGESWHPNPTFQDQLAGKAYLASLAASDSHRREFAEQVLIAPFESFVKYAEEDKTNSQKEVKMLRDTLTQLRRMFDGAPEESLEDRRARLLAEVEALGTD